METMADKHMAECGCIFNMHCPLHRAAPDLLEACKMLMEWYVSARDAERDHLPPMTPELSGIGAVLKAKAAIAKAEGR